MPDENGEPTDDEVVEVVDEGHDFLLRAIGVRGPDDPYFEKIELEVPKGKLMSLDAAVMAAHLFLAVVMFKGISELFEEKIKAMEKVVAASAAKTATGYIFKKIGIIVKLIVNIAEMWSQEEMGRKMEQKIRKASALVRRQLIEEALSQKARRRGHRRVSTRHKTLPQRKANKSWHQTIPRIRSSKR